MEPRQMKTSGALRKDFPAAIAARTLWSPLPDFLSVCHQAGIRHHSPLHLAGTGTSMLTFVQWGQLASVTSSVQ